MQTVRTDGQGQASFGMLNWYQVYVIEETAAAPDYVLDGAEAVNAEGVLTPYEGQEPQTRHGFWGSRDRV